MMSCHLVPVLLSMFALAPQEPPDAGHRVETLLRVDVTSNMLITMTTLLENEPFLGSIDSSVVPARMTVPDEVRAKLYVVRQQQVAQGIVQLTVTGPDKDIAIQVSQHIVKALGQLVPDDRKLAEERLEIAEARSRELEASIQQIELRISSLRKRAAGLDPQQWLGTLRVRLAKLMDERWDLALDIAVEEGLRKHVTHMLAELSESTEKESEMVVNPVWTDLMEKLTLARGELNLVVQGKERNDNRLEALRRQIVNLEAELQSIPKYLAGPRRQVPNPEYVSARNQLANTEFQLAQKSARLAAIEQMVERLTSEVMEFQSIADTLTESQQELQQARLNLANNQQTERSLRDQEIQRNRPILSVISGPTAFRPR